MPKWQMMPIVSTFPLWRTYPAAGRPAPPRRPARSPLPSTCARRQLPQRWCAVGRPWCRGTAVRRPHIHPPYGHAPLRPPPTAPPTHWGAAAVRPASATCTGSGPPCRAGGGYPYAYPHIHPPYGRRQALRRHRTARTAAAGAVHYALAATGPPPIPHTAQRTATGPLPPTASARRPAHTQHTWRAAGLCGTGRPLPKRQHNPPKWQLPKWQATIGVSVNIHRCIRYYTPKTRQDAHHSHLSPTAVCETLHTCTQ